MIDDETLYAWLDGELPEDEAKRVAALVAANPALGEKLEAQRQLQAGLRAAFDPVAAAPVPAGMAAIATSEGTVQSLADARARRTSRAGFGLPQWAAVAAALVAGFVGAQMLPKGGATAQDGLVASAELTQALDTQLASAGDADGAAAPVRVRLTFKDGKGDICRSFDTASTAGVACRDQDSWAVRALVSHPRQTEGSYRMATSGDAAIMAYVDAQISGDPLDAAAEKRAMAKGWKK
ncbi:hypothetical protein M2333_002036 [Sphingobium sp. B11D3B]|uniref:anti-sigma factor family protein n=1 Tax=Sphingobium sp. B11D3B TaxID=2940575 RepID=UPI002226CB3C|nr:anti-sigma factor [Sphingobium sp. B11D3B]MCW2388990.1 hypothetical protein [Sphingobium sp. B11D3B]